MNEEQEPLLHPNGRLIFDPQNLAFFGNNVEQNSQTKITLYSSRYFILTVLTILNLSNGMIWMTFGSIPDYICIYFKISTTQVDWLSIVFMVTTLVLGLPAIYLLDKFGLKISIISAAWINAVGSILRIISCVEGIRQSYYSYIVLIIGQTMCGCAQPFILFAPTKLAALWFQSDKRTLANMIASTANPIGIMLGNLISAEIMPINKELPFLLTPVIKLMIITAIPAFLGALLSLGVTRAQPPSPPASSGNEVQIEFWHGLKQLFSDKQYLKLAFCYGGGMSIISSLITIFDQLVYPYNYSNKFSSLCTSLIFGIGLVGATVSSLLADRTRKHEYIAKTNFGLASIFLILLLIACRFSSNDIMVAMLSAATGFFAISLSPLCLELSVESSFPVSEGSAAGLLIISGQLQALILTMLITIGSKPLINHQEVISAYAVIGLMLFCFIISVYFIFSYTCAYKRLNYEEQMEADLIFRNAAHLRNSIVFDRSRRSISTQRRVYHC